MHDVAHSPRQPSRDHSPAAVVARMYEVLSGPGDVERDWTTFASLFTADARLRIAFTGADGTTIHQAWTPAEFAAMAAVDYRDRGGFWERAVFERIEEFGSIAHCWSTFESREKSAENAPFARGINSIQLVRTGDGWRIAHLVWDIEQEHNPIPGEYAP